MDDEFDDIDDVINVASSSSSGIAYTRHNDKRKRNERRNRIGVRPKNEGLWPITSMDDTHLMNFKNVPQNGTPIFGVYGADEWITNSYVKQAVENGQNILVMEGTWITPAGFKLHEWTIGQTDRFNFLSTHRAFLFYTWGLVEAVYSRGKLELEIQGTPQAVLDFMKLLDTQLKRAESMIEWVYDQRGNSISVPLNYRAAVKGAYPWLKKDIEEYIHEYLNSQASVLILIGPPGTGKTTFIKNLIHLSGGDAKVTYDEKVMSDDALFANFIHGNERFMIMEDADTFLKSRADGNTMMHRFLNVSDGLVSAEGKKLVFSTNLPSIRDIDSALMRPGRCFDVVTFTSLTRDEAKVVAAELKIDLPDGKEFTLAELFNQSNSAKRESRPLGFI